MCHYITATMSADGDPHEIRRVAKGFLLKWKEIEAPAIANLLLEGERYFLTTQGMCDCETGLGAVHRANSSRPWNPKREAKKLNKRGWSEEKIKRSLAEKEQAYKRREQENESRAKASANPDRWGTFLTQVLSQGLATHVGLLLHWYSGNLQTERITLGKSEWINTDRITADSLASIKEDTLYRFRRNN